VSHYASSSFWFLDPPSKGNRGQQQAQPKGACTNKLAIINPLMIQFAQSQFSSWLDSIKPIGGQ
jgi:hypothetical protein